MTCAFRGCDRPRRDGELCASHGRQRRRGKPLRPLRGTMPSLVTVGVRVEAATREAVLANVGGARDALGRWAKRRATRRTE